MSVSVVIPFHSWLHKPSRQQRQQYHYETPKPTDSRQASHITMARARINNWSSVFVYRAHILPVTARHRQMRASSQRATRYGANCGHARLSGLGTTLHGVGKATFWVYCVWPPTDTSVKAGPASHYKRVKPGPRRPAINVIYSRPCRHAATCLYTRLAGPVSLSVLRQITTSTKVVRSTHCM